MKKTAFLSIIAMALMAFAATTANLTHDEGYTIGDTARDFSLKNVDGNMISMADYSEAKGFIVIFTCNECPYAKMYEDRIIALHNQYADQGYPVIAINPNDPAVVPGDSYEHMITRAKEKKFPFPYIYDETQEIAKAYGATRTPHVYLLNKKADSSLEVAYIGAIDNNSKDADKADKKYIEDAVEALKAGNEIPAKETKAVGCTIKWSPS